MPSRLLLRGRVLTPFRVLDPGGVLVEDGRIAWVRAGCVEVPGVEALGGLEDVVAPGFIDLQVNGMGGRDALDGTDAVLAISARLPQSGVTGFLPTVISRPLEEMVGFGVAVRRAKAEASGARVLGAHLEGPFLNPRYAGAHDRRFLLGPNDELVARLLAVGPRLVTLAPELPGALEAVRRLRRAGVLVSAGHTGASFEVTREAFRAGVGFVTHLFNAMVPMHHRRPGAAGAALAEPGIGVGLIADGVHVHPALCAAVVRSRGPAAVALTTDQTAAAGCPPGRFRLGEAEVVSDGRVTRRPDGTLAGSAATMERLVRLMAAWVGLRRAVEMASATPARLLGLAAGRIAEGLPADLVVLDPELRVRATLIGGRLAYLRAP
jgi:N-acetylglucosamine-6-phosphate deacetylase